MLPDIDTLNPNPENEHEMAREFELLDDDSTQWIWTEIVCQYEDGVNNVTNWDLGSGLDLGAEYPIGRLNYTSEKQLEFY